MADDDSPLTLGYNLLVISIVSRETSYRTEVISRFSTKTISLDGIVFLNGIFLKCSFAQTEQLFCPNRGLTVHSETEDKFSNIREIWLLPSSRLNLELACAYFFDRMRHAKTNQ